MDVHIQFLCELTLLLDNTGKLRNHRILNKTSIKELHNSLKPVFSQSNRGVSRIIYFFNGNYEEMNAKRQ